MIIGITGTDGAGKGMVVDYLVKEKGFTHYSARALFETEIEKRGIESNRANMRLVANDLRRIHGNDYLTRHYIKKAEDEGVRNAIIESVREVSAAEYLKQKGGILIAVDADQKLRYERIVSRGSSSDHISFEEFVNHEKIEMDDPDPNGMQKAKVIEMADYTITNDGTIEELNKKIESFFDDVSKK